MINFISKVFKKVAIYAYGLFTVALYGLISITRGTYFKKRTEKEHLELQLGACLDFFLFSNPQHKILLWRQHSLIMGKASTNTFRI